MILSAQVHLDGKKKKKKTTPKHLRVFSSTQACLFASLSHTCARMEEVNQRNNPEGTAGWHFHPAPVSPRAKRNSLAYGIWLNDGGANTHGFLATHTQNVSQRHRLTNPSFTMTAGRLKMRTVRPRPQAPRHIGFPQFSRNIFDDPATITPWLWASVFGATLWRKVMSTLYESRLGVRPWCTY